MPQVNQRQIELEGVCRDSDQSTTIQLVFNLLGVKHVITKQWKWPTSAPTNLFAQTTSDESNLAVSKHQRQDSSSRNYSSSTIRDYRIENNLLCIVSKETSELDSSPVDKRQIQFRGVYRNKPQPTTVQLVLITRSQTFSPRAMEVTDNCY